MSGKQGHRRAAIARRRKGKKMNLRTKKAPRLPDGVRAHHDEEGGFQMGSSFFGTSACSKRGINHRMVPNPICGGFYCINHNCLANC